MCKACKVPNPKRISPQYVRDIKRACREGQKKVPSWLAPKRSTTAELTHQLKRLAGNAKWEFDVEGTCACGAAINPTGGVNSCGPCWDAAVASAWRKI